MVVPGFPNFYMLSGVDFYMFIPSICSCVYRIGPNTHHWICPICNEVQVSAQKVSFFNKCRVLLMIFEVGIHHEDDQTRHRAIGIVLRAHSQSKQRLQH